MSQGTVIKVSGPLVVADGMREANLFDVVQVGHEHLIGEIIEMRGESASIQVYEETAGLAPGAPVTSTGAPLSVELAPGMLSHMYDGIQRPLEAMMRQSGSNIRRGIHLPAVSRTHKWKLTPQKKAGDAVRTGDVLGTVQETDAVLHKIMVPPETEGTVLSIEEGSYTVEESFCKIKMQNGAVREVAMLQRWPVRRGRPYISKLPLNEPLLTGQRVIDTFFPLARGGVAAIPGPFGSGKTVVQHQLAKWANADVVVYIGCGERGNEMTDVLHEFPAILDPQTELALMNRTVLIANTSDMPVAAREACIYTGITIAEYFRDMGYSVVLLADSTSRWAEALREMSGRLEEMPGDEGYPAYLSSRLAQFYERAGRFRCCGSEKTIGSVTAVGAVSPPGGDISEPVSQATLRIVKVFWGLDASLAYRRHFPSVNWLNSYSLYANRLAAWFDDRISPQWSQSRTMAMQLLQKEAELDEIVKLVGVEALSPSDRLRLAAAQSIREDYLQQNAFDEIDTYTSAKKQFRLLELVLAFYREAQKALDSGAAADRVLALPIREHIAKAKLIAEEDAETAFHDLMCRLREETGRLCKGEVHHDKNV